MSILRDISKVKRGNIALITVLVLTGIVVVVSVSLLLQTINFNNSTYSYNSNLFAEARGINCMEESLRELRSDVAFDDTINIEFSNGSCSASIASVQGEPDQRDIVIDANVNNHFFNKSIRIDVTQNNVAIVQGPTSTPTITLTPSNTPVATATSTPTNTPTSTPTNTPLPATSTPTPTNTPLPPTNTPTSTPTNTPTSTPTNTPLPPTNTPTSTPTPTNTPLPPTNTPTSTPTPTTGAIALVQTVTGGASTGASISLTSWTPGSNQLVLVSVAVREEANTVTVSGNGLTFVEIYNVDNIQGQGGVHMFRAMGASPTTGQITVSIPTNTKPVSISASRFSGVNTTGTNGSGAVEVTAMNVGPATDNDDVKQSITTLTNNAWAFAAAWHRTQTLSNPPATGQTAVTINQSYGSGGDVTQLTTWYEKKVTAGLITMGQDNNASTNQDWAMIVVSIKPS